MPEISVIVPVYNVREYLRACVASVENQTETDWELILVDDGSADGSGALCDMLAARDKAGRIRVLHKANGGLSDARNSGLAAAVGHYVLFLDGDDFYCESTALSKLLGAARTADADMVCFNYRRCSEQGVFQGAPLTNFPKSVLNEPYESAMLRLVKANAYLSSACFKLVRRSVVEQPELRFVRGVLSEDIEWSARLLLRCKSVAWAPEVVYGYRLRERSITRSVSQKNVQDQLATLNKLQALEKPPALRSALEGYLAFQYGALLINGRIARPRISAQQRRQIRALRFMLEADGCAEVTLLRRCCRLCGFTLTSWLVSVYFCLFRRG